MVTLWRVADPAAAVSFDRRGNVGLHHLALRVKDIAVLETVHERVRAHPGTAIELRRSRCAKAPRPATSRA